MIASRCLVNAFAGGSDIPSNVILVPPFKDYLSAFSSVPPRPAASSLFSFFSCTARGRTQQHIRPATTTDHTLTSSPPPLQSLPPQDDMTSSNNIRRIRFAIRWFVTKHLRLPYVYRGGANGDVPTDVTRVEVHPSVEEIGEEAFLRCTLLREITIPPAVKVIRKWAFGWCSGMTTVVLGEGLEEIGAFAFRGCASLHSIEIPTAVKVIKQMAFHCCSQLTTVVLGEGLEEIQSEAFGGCVLLQRIAIPRAVTAIHYKAFDGCPNLTNVVFCDEIEEFVSGESFRDWWNHGVHESCLDTYSFLVRCNIPERVGRVRAMKWRTNIHLMLQSIPTPPQIPHIPHPSFSYIPHPANLLAHLNLIDSKLTFYEKLNDAAALLELAIWKSNIIKHCGQNIDLLTTETKVQCRDDSDTMITIIVPNVLSFLTDDYGDVDFYHLRDLGLLTELEHELLAELEDLAELEELEEIMAIEFGF